MNQKKFEEALSGLTEMSEKIKAGSTTLEEAVACYEEGMKYYSICSDILENAKQKIEMCERED